MMTASANAEHISGGTMTQDLKSDFALFVLTGDTGGGVGGFGGNACCASTACWGIVTSPP